MDRGAWIKNSEIKACRRTQKGKKSKSTKSAKWCGNEEQMNISVYHMLQSCGVQAGSYPKTEVKNEAHIPGLKRVILTLKYWFPFPKLDYHQWFKVHTFAIWEIRHLEEFNMLVLLSKQLVAQRRSCLEICVHQVVTNCCICNFFPKFIKKIGPSTSRKWEIND